MDKDDGFSEITVNLTNLSYAKETHYKWGTVYEEKISESDWYFRVRFLFLGE